MSATLIHAKFRKIKKLSSQNNITHLKPQSVHVFSAALPVGWRRPFCLLHLEAARLQPPTPVLTVPASKPPTTPPGSPSSSKRDFSRLATGICPPACPGPFLILDLKSCQLQNVTYISCKDLSKSSPKLVKIFCDNQAVG